MLVSLILFEEIFGKYYLNIYIKLCKKPPKYKIIRADKG